jgi:surface antigen
MVGTLLAVSAPAEALQCVPFAREVSGISIRGDAWTWWTAAAGQYDRGHAPRIGAVVVFKKFAAMRYGHVAVVARVVNSREVLVNHANWAPHRGLGRGQVSKMVAVADVSPQNDWTEVRVWNAATRDYGTRTYPTYGFIYPGSSLGPIRQASVTRDEPSGVPHRPVAPVGDGALATADRQIAAVLADACDVVSDSGQANVAGSESATKTFDANSGYAKATAVAVNDVKPTLLAAATANRTAVSSGDGAWESDSAAAKQVGSGHH